MTELQIRWIQESKNSIRVHVDFCCQNALETYTISHPQIEEGKLDYRSLFLSLFRRHAGLEKTVGLKVSALIDIPHYAIGLPNGRVIAYCPFCGAKVVSINTETGERLEWATVLLEEKKG